MPNGVRGRHHRQGVVNRQCTIDISPAVLRAIGKSLRGRPCLYGLIPDGDNTGAAIFFSKDIQFITNSRIDKSDDHTIPLQCKRRILHLDIAHGIQALRIERHIPGLHQSIQLRNGRIAIITDGHRWCITPPHIRNTIIFIYPVMAEIRTHCFKELLCPFIIRDKINIII